MEPAGVAFSSLIRCSECVLRPKAQRKVTHPPSWTCLGLISLCDVLRLCHSFKGCALPPLLLSQFQTIYLIGYMMARRNINNLRDTDDTTLMAESKEELKSFLMRVKEESEKTSLRLNIKEKKKKTMASSPITSANRRGKSGNSGRFYFLGLQKSLLTVASAMKLKDTCSLEGKLWKT